jgi:ABC-type multidrug transport system fused ATPase/permease subunit
VSEECRVCAWNGSLILFCLYDLSLSIDDIVIQDDQIKAMGGLETVDLGFSDIRMELKTGKKNANGNGKKLLLDGSITGRAQPGRMLAIMGPSGAGKVCRQFISTFDLVFLDS